MRIHRRRASAAIEVRASLPLAAIRTDPFISLYIGTWKACGLCATPSSLSARSRRADFVR